MKKILLAMLVLITLLGTFSFMSCEAMFPVFYPEVDEPYITFEEAIKPYVDMLGLPEEINEYHSGNDYHIIDYWWWTKGIMHSFEDTPYNDTNGWCWASSYSFDPIDY